MHIQTLASMNAEGRKPDVLFWVGCSGSFDERAKKITRAFVKILNLSFIEVIKPPSRFYYNVINYKKSVYNNHQI